MDDFIGRSAEERQRRALAEAKKHDAGARPDSALAALRDGFGPDSEFSLLVRAARWVASREWPGARPLKIAFLGGGVLDQVIDLTGFWLALHHVRLQPYCSLFDTWRMDVLKEDGPLYRFGPDLVWFFNTRRDVPAADGIAERLVEEQKARWAMVRERLPATTIIQNTVDPAPDRPYGNLDGFLPGGRLHLLRSYNDRLAAEAGACGVLPFDLAHLAACCGLRNWCEPAYWYHSKHPFSPALSGYVAYHMARHVLAIGGGSKKALVLDLDNTLWGGVVGDDGVDGIVLGNGPDGQAFQEFQRYLKALSSRGIVLSVASKNNEDTAREAFMRHPGMVLSLDDIAVFKANWRNKADNIREIAATLNLGLDAFVFVDDNPAERELVRRELPMVDVLELPGDPAGYVDALDAQAYFEAVAISDEDLARAGMYRANAARSIARAEVTNLDEYLRGLEMIADCGPADGARLARMSQLVNKSNQFHLTTTRYSEAELAAFADDPSRVVRWYSLADRFGDYGLIAVAVLQIDAGAAIIDTWAMSCRVLERGLEEFILRDLAEQAAQKGCDRLRGVYIPSRKNGLVAELYGRLGFSRLDDDGLAWELPLPAQRGDIPLHIRQKDGV